MDENLTIVVDCETSLKMKKPKFGWDNRSFMVFVDSFVIEVRKCNKTGTHLTKVGWENIQKHMKDKTEWKLYDQLMRLETGLGGTRSLIDASPEWWDEKIKENKDYAKFRNVNLSIFDEKSVAVGDQTMTPLQFQNNSNPNGENVEGKGDSDDINLDDEVEPLFPSFH
ncbi:uncharacterized protein LOC122194470 [Lactuca sativa]|uniref:uncharacterized protein LOC122194470 n=1 Tax=Lactuca sativa TaxID=4236 RepID=UPI001C689C13|nr:uncharacterized protein LOC122194470 [Lactuca sativa]